MSISSHGLMAETLCIYAEMAPKLGRTRIVLASHLFIIVSIFYGERKIERSLLDYLFLLVMLCRSQIAWEKVFLYIHECKNKRKLQ